jgi:hypothetical protein
MKGRVGTMYKFYERSKGIPYKCEKSALNVVKSIQDATPYVLIVRSDSTRRMIDDEIRSHPESVYHICDVDEEMSWDGDELSSVGSVEFSDMEDIEEDEIKYKTVWKPSFNVNDRDDLEGITYVRRTARVIDVNKVKHGVTDWNEHEIMPRFYHFRKAVFRRKEKTRRMYEEAQARERIENERIVRGRDGFAIRCNNCNYKFFIWRDKHESLLAQNKNKRFCRDCMNKLFSKNKHGNKNYINNRRKLNFKR